MCRRGGQERAQEQGREQDGIRPSWTRVAQSSTVAISASSAWAHRDRSRDSRVGDLGLGATACRVQQPRIPAALPCRCRDRPGKIMRASTISATRTICPQRKQPNSDSSWSGRRRMQNETIKRRQRRQPQVRKRSDRARTYYLSHKDKLTADEAEELRQRLETRKATQTLSDLFRPFQTCSNFPALLKPFLY